MRDVPIPPGANRGPVPAGEGDERAIYALNLGRLDPHDTIRGVQPRRSNPGLLKARWTDSAAFAFFPTADPCDG